MKSIGKHAYLFVMVLALAGLLFLAVPKAMAQQDSDNNDADDNFNPPPCDFNDQFYADNGIDVTQLIGRFGDNGGTTRLTGPPARGRQHNYVADNTCSTNDPTRRNFRILATTGGNSDDNNSPFTCATVGPSASPGCATASALEPETFEFISILAFLNSQNPFAQGPYVRTVGFINGGLQGVQQNPGEDISIGATLNVAGQTIVEAPGQTLRGFAMQDIVTNFEAYAALRQTTPHGFASNPCSNAMIAQLQNPNILPTDPTPQPCFPVADTVVNGQVVSDVATPNLRQDWRFATNRNAMDGSDGNNPFAASPNSAPFGYFCDDLLGMWIITYFWVTAPPNDTECGPVYQSIGKLNGFNTDGTPIVLTAFELNTELEGHLDALGNAHACGAEAKEAMDGSDGGAVFLICPALPDPRAGAIASDAFLDQVFNANGSPNNPVLTVNFLSLQIFGKFPNELTPTQTSQLKSTAASRGLSFP
jgi:hypothetical protein